MKQIFLLALVLGAGCLGLNAQTSSWSGNSLDGNTYRNGNVGVGIDIPQYKLHVVQDGWKARFSGSDGYIDIGPANSSWAHIYSDRPNFIFNKPVYSTNGFHSYNSHLNLEAASGYYVQIKPRSSSFGLILREYNSNDYGNIEVTSSGLGIGYNTSGSHLMISTNGNIGVGTSTPEHLLDVAGTIHTQEVKVDMNGWSDFVFHPTYNLRSIQEVHTYIQQNGHLPEIPTAKEVEENGISLGEMNAKLLQKIEELTLYVIELNEELDTLKKEIKNK